MTHIKKQLRSGVPAIAFALAFSPMPLLAQTAAAPPVVTLPTPAPPVSTPAPTLPTPAAPTLRAAAPAAEPAATEARTQQRATSTRRTAATAPRQQPAARASAPVAEAPVAQAEPLAPPPVAPLAEAPVIEPAPASVPAEPVASEGDSDLLPIAGGLAGLLLLGGGAYALSRRRRDPEGDGYAAETWEEAHVAYAEPVAAAAPAATPEPAMARTGQLDPTLPSVAAGADTSRYGRHTQAAYAGPTPDNPSLSLKRRLKRAAFFDHRERMALEAGEPSDMAQPVASPHATPSRERLVTSRRVSPKASTQALFGFRPAFQN